MTPVIVVIVFIMLSVGALSAFKHVAHLIVDHKVLNMTVKLFMGSHTVMTQNGDEYPFRESLNSSVLNKMPRDCTASPLSLSGCVRCTVLCP